MASAVVESMDAVRLATFFLIVAHFPLSDSSGVTWFEPPPVEVITDSTATPTVNRNFTKGLEENLSWNFSLTADLSLITVTVAFKSSAPVSSFDDVATYVQSLGKASVQTGFKDQFNVSWVPSKITLTVFNVSAENNGEFECRLLLFDGSGTNTWKRKIQVIVLGHRPTDTNLTTNLTNNIVVLNDPFRLMCKANASPPAHYRLYKQQQPLTTITDNQAVGTFTTTVGERIQQVTYSCTPFNYFGVGPSDTVNVTVHYKPANVSLVANPTENKNCSDLLRVNFTCVASEANPEVQSFLLYDGQNESSVSNNGTWLKDISVPGKHIYGCIALHPEGNVYSLNTVTVAFNVPVQIFVNVVSDNETFPEGGDASLYCNASGYPEPTVTWSKLGANGFVNRSRWLNFTNITREDRGNYSCRANNTCGTNSFVQSVNVQYKPANVSLVAEPTENENCSDLLRVNFTCVASEANPEVESFLLYDGQNESSVSKSGTWLKDISVPGKHVYGCIALHPEGNVNSLNTVTVTFNVPVQIFVNVISDNETFSEGSDASLYCNASGYPDPTVTWSKLGDDGFANRSAWLNFTNITREDRGNYICRANNTCGTNTSVQFINVQYKPRNVSLVAEPTENENCSDLLRVNFTCVASDANPEVERFLLDDGQNGSSVSKSGTWLKDISVPGKHVYGCIALHPEGNVNSLNTITVSFNVQTFVNVISDNETFSEGGDTSLYCNASGYPDPTVTWSKIGDDGFVNRSAWLNFTNITREDRGNYICRANNTCGTNSSIQSVDVQYKPATVSLVADPTENENCSDLLRVLFICVASDANPAVKSYLLYDGGNESSASNNGIWVKDISVPGKHVYGCIALHPEGNVNSSNTVTVTLNVPVKISVNVITANETLEEGGNVALLCDASGHPNPTVSWSKHGDQGFVNQNGWLNFTKIRRVEAGNYVCHANNTCGKNYSVRTVDVQYKPINVTLKLNMSKSKVCKGDVVEFKCKAEAANPAVHTYTLYKNGVILENMGSIGVTRRALDTEGQVTYKCEATNSVGTTASANKTVVVEVPALVTNVSNTTVVKVGENVTLLCSVSGDPAPNVSWVNFKNDLMILNSTWEIVNIGRNYTGGYKCIASNECGSHSKTTNISVEFSPSATSSGRNRTVRLGTPVSFTCPVDGNPPPSVRWYKGSEPSGTVLSSEKEFEFIPNSLSDTGLYTCFAYNYLGNISVRFVIEVVVDPTSPATPSPTTPRELTVVLITLTITNKDCNNFPEEEFRVEIKKTLEHLGLKDIEIKTRCGSVIVDLGLGFNQSVGVNDVISTLKDAASDGKFGDFNVDSNSIRQTSSNSTSSPSPTTNAEGTPECSCSCNTVLGVIIGILVAIIIVLIIIIVWQHKKGTTKRPYEVPPHDAGFYDNEIAMEDISPTHVPPNSSAQRLSMYGPGHRDLQEVTRSDKYRTDQSRPITSQQQNPSQPAEYMAPLTLRTRSWEVAREHVTVDKIIGKGAFGQVAKATAIQLPFRNGKTTVAVKMLKPNAAEADKKDLLSELELMKTLKPHPHIIKLMGCVTLSEPLLVLIEYVPYGDLLGYLRKSRGLNDTYYKDPDVKPQTSLTSQQLMKFAWQIADGMSYLSSRKIIHRDLAARNVLVGERETCKVTDFGMARDVQQEDIYEKTTRGRLPVKWTAYESLLYGTYTTKSDVWSFGIVLYELFTIGGSPYPRMEGKRIANALRHGYRMPKPQHVDDALYQTMMNCWQKEPEARPSFPALTKQLKEMEKQHQRLINMRIYDNELYGNLEDLNV